jgi:hypothetical protein
VGGFDAGDEVIMSIAGHVTRAMLSRYSHVRMAAMRHALDEIAARHRAAKTPKGSRSEAACRGCSPSGAGPVGFGAKYSSTATEWCQIISSSRPDADCRFSNPDDPDKTLVGPAG